MKKWLFKADPIVYIYILLLITGLCVTNELHQFRKELKTFRGSVVYDIDKVRDTLIEESQFLFSQGCRWGTEYPEEYRQSNFGFNVNSPVNYCNEEFKNKWEQYVYEKAAKIGKNEDL